MKKQKILYDNLEESSLANKLKDNILINEQSE